MERLTSTPFGRRPASLGQIAAATRARSAGDVRPVDKWALLRDLTTARHAYGLTDRDLVVLNALLSFHPGAELSDPARLIVFPSNATLSQRAHGMPESTLRRHLAALTGSGLVLRHDSPNGKRYAARGADGAITRAFGFDLAPLLDRAAEIAQAARDAEAAALRLKRLREEVVLVLRDVLKLLPLADDRAEWLEDAHQRLRDARRIVRRRPHLPTLLSVLDDLSTLRSRLGDALTGQAETEDQSASDSQNERHYKSPEKEYSEIDASESLPTETAKAQQRPISLALVRTACPDLEAFAGQPIQDWSQLSRAAGRVAEMLRIPKGVWHAAETTMGRVEAAVTVACILQRAEKIGRPGAYLRNLTRKAAEKTFTPLPMLLALTSPPGPVPS